MLPKFSYVRPQTSDEALQLLSESGTRIHAGGTDLIGCLRDGVMRVDQVVSLSALNGLKGIREEGDQIRIGALTTVADVAASALLSENCPVLSQAAATVASPQLRNQGTLGGNLCQRPRCWYFRGEFHCLKKGGAMCFAFNGENRYHAIFGGGPCYIVHPSDTAPALVALGASLRINSPRGERTIPAEDFFQLPSENLTGETDLLRAEMVEEILIPKPVAGSRSSYRKVRERGSWDFALTSVALSVRFDGETVRDARVVLGGVAPIPWRSKSAEEAIKGRRLDSETVAQAAQAAVEGAEPLEQNGYKVLLTKGVVEESLLAL